MTTASGKEPFAIPWEDLWPRDEQHRYRLYRLCECPDCDRGKIDGERCPTCRGEGRIRDLLTAVESPEALGVALVQLGREGEFQDCAAGVLDVLGDKGQKWVLLPWLPSPRNTSDAGRVLASAKRGENR